VGEPFTHVDRDGKLRMVDVSDKEPTLRTAEASCVVNSSVDVFALESSQGGFDPIYAARLAGIQAAKKTSHLIPLCHPINLNDVQVDVVRGPRGVEVIARVVTINRTGVEMEALTACSFAALSLINALAVRDPDAGFADLVLLRKSGGKSADWGRLVDPPTP